MALTFGEYDVPKFKRKLGSRQLEAWLIYQKLYGPVNPVVRNDIALAGVRETISALTSVIIRIWTKKHARQSKLKDFLPFPIEAKRQQTAQDHLKLMEMMVLMSGGKDLRKQ